MPKMTKKETRFLEQFISGRQDLMVALDRAQSIAAGLGPRVLSGLEFEIGKITARLKDKGDAQQQDLLATCVAAVSRAQKAHAKGGDWTAEVIFAEIMLRRLQGQADAPLRPPGSTRNATKKRKERADVKREKIKRLTAKFRKKDPTLKRPDIADKILIEEKAIGLSRGSIVTIIKKQDSIK